jgi:hypothetical protein
MRGDMYVQAVTPYAIRMQKVMNPVYAMDGEENSPAVLAFLDGPYNTASRAAHRSTWDGGSWYNDPTTGWQTALGTANKAWIPHTGYSPYPYGTPTVLGQWQKEGYNALDPQPVYDTWAAFAAGDTRARPASTNLAWFRIYRERPSDHNNDGNPWYDTVPLTYHDSDLGPEGALRSYDNHSVFIIACGAGPTQGYRFWDVGDAGYDAALEPMTAKASGLFIDEEMFRQMRQNERILWYRAEWTAMTGGGANAIDHHTQAPGGILTGQINTSQGGANQYESWGSIVLDNHLISFFGAFKWIQRLEQAPPKW